MVTMADKKALFSELFTNTDDDSGVQKVKDLKDPEEIKAAIEILEEEIDKSEEDNLSGFAEPNPEEGEEENSEGQESEEDGEGDNKTGGEAGEGNGDDDGSETKFQLTDEIIAKHPEDKQLLERFKDKDKSEIAKAAANAIALKNEYLKDDKEAIELLTKKLLEKPDDELVQTLIRTQRETGRVEQPPAEIKPETIKLELPKLPEDDPKVRAILSQEVIKNLRKNKKYADIPEDVEDINSEKFLEWTRDLQDANPLNSLKEDLANAQKVVGEDLSKVLYIQQNLSNLYDESPAEILPLLNEQNLPRLKAINDNPMNVLMQDVKGEIEVIKKQLSKYGLTEKDIDIDFSITEDEHGKPYNEVINQLIMKGLTPEGNAIPDPEIIGESGRAFWLKKGQLAKKFKDEFEDKIFTAFVNKKTQAEKTTRAKLKKDALIEVSGKKGSGSGSRAITIESIQKERDPLKVKQILSQLE
jgi:hypothetical protein